MFGCNVQLIKVRRRPKNKYRLLIDANFALYGTTLSVQFEFISGSEIIQLSGVQIEKPILDSLARDLNSIFVDSTCEIPTQKLRKWKSVSPLYYSINGDIVKSMYHGEIDC